MKNRPAADGMTELPPAPAPTARDANRWPLSSGARDGQAGTPARTPRRRRATPGGGEAGATRRRSFLQGASAPLVVAIVMGAIAFLRGRGDDFFDSHKGLLIALAIIAFIIFSRVGKRASSGHKHGDDGAS